ncbi:hypothetical protein ES703_58468 [subsurface metagenome]
MDREFEKGKQLLLEGIDGLARLLEPYIKLNQGMKILGITDLVDLGEELTESVDKYDMLKLVLHTWTSELKRAKDNEEVRQTIQNNRELLKRLF